MSNRDPDPLESQVRILFGKAAGQCSYPDCGRNLVAPSRARGDLPRNTAKIGHITAASPGGPRYDASLTVDERRSEPNLILLCGGCHDAVDGQLSHHTVEWLLDVKAKHEAKIDRGYRYSIGAIGFGHLEIICKMISVDMQAIAPEIEDIDESMDIDAKIEYNRLSDDTRGFIELGMAQDKEVRRFLRTFDLATPGFSTRLTAWFKKYYYEGVAEGLSPDACFGFILGAAYENCGVQLTPEVSAAALATVAHLFSICEIFEHEPAVA